MSGLLILSDEASVLPNASLSIEWMLRLPTAIAVVSWTCAVSAGRKWRKPFTKSCIVAIAALCVTAVNSSPKEKHWQVVLILCGAMSIGGLLAILTGFLLGPSRGLSRQLSDLRMVLSQLKASTDGHHQAMGIEAIAAHSVLVSSHAARETRLLSLGNGIKALEELWYVQNECESHAIAFLDEWNRKSALAASQQFAEIERDRKDVVLRAISQLESSRQALVNTVLYAQQQLMMVLALAALAVAVVSAMFQGSGR